MWYIHVFKSSLFFNLVFFSSTILTTYVSNNFIKERYDKIVDQNKFIIKTSMNLTSIIHTILSVYLGCLVLMDQNFWADRVFYITDNSTNLSYLTCGYFLYDIVMCLKQYKHCGIIFVVHGTIAFLINLFCAWLRVGHFYNAGFILWELSTPILYVRSLFTILEIKKFRKVIDTILITTFFSVRILLGVLWSYLLWNDTALLDISKLTPFVSQIRYLPFVLNTIMNTMNTYWFYLMFCIFFKKKVKV